MRLSWSLPGKVCGDHFREQSLSLLFVGLQKSPELLVVTEMMTVWQNPDEKDNISPLQENCTVVQCWQANYVKSTVPQCLLTISFLLDMNKLVIHQPIHAGFNGSKTSSCSGLIRLIRRHAGCQQSARRIHPHLLWCAGNFTHYDLIIEETRGLQWWKFIWMSSPKEINKMSHPSIAAPNYAMSLVCAPEKYNFA